MSVKHYLGRRWLPWSVYERLVQEHSAVCGEVKTFGELLDRSRVLAVLRLETEDGYYVDELSVERLKDAIRKSRAEGDQGSDSNGDPV